jgi:hypothetical protein
LERLVRPFVGLNHSSKEVTVFCEPSDHMSDFLYLSSSTPRRRIKRHGELILFHIYTFKVEEFDVVLV